MPQLKKTRTHFVRTSSCKLVSVCKFSDMCTTGVKIRDIATHYDIGVHEVHELRKRLGLPSRVSVRYTLEDTAADGYQYVNRDKLIELYEANIPIRVIAERIGTSYSTCYSLTKKLGLSRVKPLKGRCLATIEQENNFRRMYSEGKSYEKISETLGISVQRCYNMRNELSLSKEDAICSQIGSKTSTERSYCECTATMSQSR